jgi:hypothetical protein
LHGIQNIWKHTCGLVGEYAGEVGEYAGDVGEYWEIGTLVRQEKRTKKSGLYFEHTCGLVGE